MIYDNDLSDVNIITREIEYIISSMKGVSFINGIFNYKIKRSTYIMFNNDTNLFKIGMSYSPEKRVDALQEIYPGIELLAVCDFNVENEIHKDYVDNRMKKEFFRLDFNQIKNIIDKYRFHIINYDLYEKIKESGIKNKQYVAFLI